jgi:signal transduction histidine kinase
MADGRLPPNATALRPGKKLPRHYYTPRPIRDIEGLTRRPRDERHDTITATAEALIASGVLTADMLPAPGKCGISWRPTDGKRERGGSWFWVPGYLEVKRRPDGSFTVILTVSREEQLRRGVREAQDSESEARAEIRRERDRRRAQGYLSEGDHAKRELASMFTSHETFSNWYVDHLYRSVESEIRLTNEHLCRDGFAMEQEALDEFLGELQEALDVLRHGASVFNAVKRATRVQELRAKIAAEDDDFRPFLDKLVSDRKESSHG